jgi:hypothetical protein
MALLSDTMKHGVFINNSTLTLVYKEQNLNLSFPELLAFRTTKRNYWTLDEYCKLNRITHSEVLRQILSEFLDQEMMKPQQKAMPRQEEAYA